MLDIKKVESTNECYITGILNELEIAEGSGVDKNGKSYDYIRGVATIRVDQEENGKVVENLIPVSMFSKRKKNDGTDNKVFDRIKNYGENFISAAAAEDISQATRISVMGKTVNIGENAYVNKNTGKINSTFQISSNFLNLARESDKEQAVFELSGVVLNFRPEVNSQEEETGRLIISFGIIGYGGRISVVNLYAEDNAKSHIESNWNKGDTVKVVGNIKMTQKVITWNEEIGFGKPIERKRVESRRELVVTGGSACGLDEGLSYDADDIKVSLAERKAYQDELLENAKSASKPAPKKAVDNFGF